jgi:hypothetical protein
MDAPSASAALEALQAENAWALSGPLLAACMEAGTIVSPLLLQHILLVATQDKSWRIAKEVLQVHLTLNDSSSVPSIGTRSTEKSSIYSNHGLVVVCGGLISGPIRPRANIPRNRFGSCALCTSRLQVQRCSCCLPPPPNTQFVVCWGECL